MEWIAEPTGWLGLGTLILMEIVLGIDNLIFIAILVDKLPPRQRHLARIIGLSLALFMRVAMLAGISWLQTLTAPLVTVLGARLSVRDLILISGGVFLLFKATTELHGRLEGREATEGRSGAASAAFWQVVVQIVILDFVFSLDSVITAVGMVDQFSVMVIAVVVAIVAMMVISGPLTTFINSHPTIVILALGFLLMIGFSLFAEGWGFKIPKEYLYAAIVFSVIVETLNQIATRKRVERAKVGNLRSRTAEAVLRLLGGSRGERAIEEDMSSVLATGAAADVFAPAERTIVRRVLSLAERPVQSIMTPAREVIWLELEDEARTLSRKILQAGHAAYPVCRGALRNLIGVGRTADLICDLLQNGRISLTILEREPLTLAENVSVLNLVERLRDARVPMAIVNDDGGEIKGVVTSTDLIKTILGEQHQQK
jgi:predicted tellurium resistance membrane protein TerC